MTAAAAHAFVLKTKISLTTLLCRRSLLRPLPKEEATWEMAVSAGRVRQRDNHGIFGCF